MRARIPAGIDLEDKLLYGLSPARLGYVVGLAVLASWFWRQPIWAPLRLVPALLALALAGAVGWLKHDGRHLDAWAEDLVRHLLARYRVEVDWNRLRQLTTSLRARFQRAPP
jgi:hypothetical protein